MAYFLILLLLTECRMVCFTNKYVLISSQSFLVTKNVTFYTYFPSSLLLQWVDIQGQGTSVKILFL